MGTRESRAEERKQRKLERKQRMLASQARQRAADIENYGADSALLNLQPSFKADARGGIWDVSTDNYEQEPSNQVNKNDSVNNGNGIDSIDSTTESGDPGGGGGVPSGFSAETLDIVTSGNSAGQRVFLTKSV
jgi:hypothetical protein